MACSLRQRRRPGMVLSKNSVETLEAAPEVYDGRRSVARGRRLVCLAIGRRRCRGVAAFDLSGGLQSDVEPSRGYPSAEFFAACIRRWPASSPTRCRAASSPRANGGAQAAWRNSWGFRGNPRQRGYDQGPCRRARRRSPSRSMVMVMGTSSCHMLNARRRSSCPASRESSRTAFCQALRLRNRSGRRGRCVRLVAGHARAKWFSRTHRAGAARFAARRGRCLLHGLVQRLSHAPDGRLAARGIYRSCPAPRPPPLLPRRPRSLGLWTPLDHRSLGGAWPAREATGGHRRPAAPQPLADANLRRRVGSAHPRSSFQARTRPRRGDFGRVGGGKETDGIQVRGGCHLQHGEDRRRRIAPSPVPIPATHWQYEGHYQNYRALAGVLDPVSARRSLHQVGSGQGR